MDRKNLDYLQWLQRNAHLYWISMAALTFLVVATFCTFFTAPWQPQQHSIAFWSDDSDDASETLPDETDQQPEENTANTVLQTLDDTVQGEGTGVAAHQENTSASVMQQPSGAQVEQREPDIQEADRAADTPSTEQTDTQQEDVQDDLWVDPAALPGYQPPCSNAPRYHYGVGYDATYGDYRFHADICYPTDGCTVTAVTDGTVQQVQLADATAAQLIVQYGDFGRVLYRGLQTCTLAEGQAVTAGQSIGTASDVLHVSAEKNKAET